MTALALNWIWHLASPNLSVLIGLILMGLGIAIAILRKIGNWT